jgi:hypothetical protein
MHAQRPMGVTLAKDVARRETNRTKNERQHLWKHKRRLKGVARATAKVRGRRPLPSRSP